jgi:hypothetical protein
MPSHFDTFTVPHTGSFIAVCGAGGGSGFRGQNSPYRGGGGGSGAKASKIFAEVFGDVLSILVPDPGTHNVLQDGSDAVYAFARPLHCTAAAGKAPQFFGPVGLGGAAINCVGDVIVAGTDGDGPVPDFTVGAGHTGGASPDGTPGGTGGAVDDPTGGQDGPSPGAGGGGGGSMSVAAANEHSACSGGYVLVYDAADWPTYPAGLPTGSPIATYGTPPPPPPVIAGRKSAFVM